MVNWLLAVESECNDPAREDEFKEWYEKTHFTDVMETPGFIKATLYELVQPTDGKAKFIAIYEIAAEDIDTVMETHQENMKNKREAGRFSSLTSVLSRGVYKQTGSG
ncbi:DUF4286 family protein [Chloroflexota bacterium]